MNNISLLVAFAKTDLTNAHQEISLGKISNSQGQQINAGIGFKINGAIKILTAHGIRHAMKQHADHRQQQMRSQHGLVDTDFELIPSILNTPDQVLKGTVSSRGKDVLKFTKEIKGCRYFVIMSIEHYPELRIIFNTMYIK